MTIRLIRTYNAIGLAIHVAMWIWCVIRGVKTAKVYNHLEIGFGELTSGAMREGVRTTKWEEYRNSKRMDVIEYPLTITPDQELKGMHYINNAEHTPYEFENFWWHLVKIVTGKWKGSKTSRQTYCYEHGGRFLQKIGYKLDIYMNPVEFKNWADKNLIK